MELTTADKVDYGSVNPETAAPKDTQKLLLRENKRNRDTCSRDICSSHRMCQGFAFLPIVLGLLSVATVLTTYLISLNQGHVVPFFPYISDTGTKPPESCIFSQFFNIAGFLAFCTIYIRYKMVEEYCNMETDRKTSIVNKIAFAVGFLAALGLTIVGNFQETNVEPVHLTGAGLVFVGGCIYALLDVFISYWMLPKYCSFHVFRGRFALFLISTASTIAGFVSGKIAFNEYYSIRRNYNDLLHWTPNDLGFVAHVISSICEWVMALSFISYFFTFIPDFQKVKMQLFTTLQFEEIPPSVEKVENVPSTSSEK